MAKFRSTLGRRIAKNILREVQVGGPHGGGLGGGFGGGFGGGGLGEEPSAAGDEIAFLMKDKDHDGHDDDEQAKQGS